MNQQPRYAFLDLYRALFVVLMVEGHVVRGLLDVSAHSGFGFDLHEMLHGITAPGFLFGAGFAFAIATQRRSQQLQTLTPHFLRRLWRAVQLILIGYALHLPYFSIEKTFTQATPQQWLDFLNFGILQCIGVGLLLLRLLYLMLKTDARFLSAIGILIVLTVYVTPVLWSQEISASLPQVLGMAVNGLQGSFFPLFPFVAFLLSGVFVSWIFLRAAQTEREHLVMRWLPVAGLVLIGGGFVLDFLPFQSYASYNFWFTSPNYFWIRLGVLLLLMSGFWYLETSLGRHPSSVLWKPQWLVTIGIESFFVYIVHLVLVHGWLTNPGFDLETLIGPTLGWFSSLVIAAGLIAVLAALASGWRFLKRSHPPILQGLIWWFWFMFLYIFLRNPY